MNNLQIKSFLILFHMIKNAALFTYCDQHVHILEKIWYGICFLCRLLVIIIIMIFSHFKNLVSDAMCRMYDVLEFFPILCFTFVDNI